MKTLRIGDEAIITKGSQAGKQGIIEFGCFADDCFMVRLASGAVKDDTVIVSKACLRRVPHRH